MVYFKFIIQSSSVGGFDIPSQSQRNLHKLCHWHWNFNIGKIKGIKIKNKRKHSWGISCLYWESDHSYTSWCSVEFLILGTLKLKLLAMNSNTTFLDCSLGNSIREHRFCQIVYYRVERGAEIIWILFIDTKIFSCQFFFTIRESIVKKGRSILYYALWVCRPYRLLFWTLELVV